MKNKILTGVFLLAMCCVGFAIPIGTVFTQEDLDNASDEQIDSFVGFVPGVSCYTNRYSIVCDKNFATLIIDGENYKYVNTTLRVSYSKKVWRNDKQTIGDANAFANLVASLKQELKNKRESERTKVKNWRINNIDFDLGDLETELDV